MELSKAVPQGYKLTDAGVIPKDWALIPLRNLASEISDGIHSTPSYVHQSDYHFVNGNNLVNGKIHITEKTNCVSEVEYHQLKKPLTPQSILLSINGTIGNIAFFNNETVVLGKSAAYINLKKDVSKEFISFTLASQRVSQYFENELTGTTIRNLSLESLKNTPIAIPLEVDEQKAIAAALSDVDALLAQLDALITKKRDLKQAAMQQLLTAQTRLPGFSGEWPLEKIDSFTSFITKGSTPTTYGFEWQNSGVLFLRSECVSENGLDLTQSKYISNDAHQTLIRGEVRAGDILMTITGNVGRVVLLSSKFEVANINQHVARIRINKPTVSPAYLYHWLSQPRIRKDFNTITTGQAYPQISLKQVRDALVPLPSISEQITIARILSDMDAEITALEARRDKTRALKQGMMQELLTGKTRLIQN
ncbi:restriction endonuclease subunit S [Chitinibacter sp. S2-10]|uniref:restriction endonuclease subunit S n=1 Tax=Chitinibacter sp. S2-10 TaxID=3373597 RepID=UPI003977977A